VPVRGQRPAEVLAASFPIMGVSDGSSIPKEKIINGVN